MNIFSQSFFSASKSTFLEFENGRAIFFFQTDHTLMTYPVEIFTQIAYVLYFWRYYFHAFMGEIKMFRGKNDLTWKEKL